MNSKMKRRKFIINAAGFGCGSLMGPIATRLWAQRTGEEKVSPVYAESAAIFGVSAGGTEEARARFSYQAEKTPKVGKSALSTDFVSSKPSHSFTMVA